ncbi:type I-E CRISPR-associated protein Cas5/CasD [Leucobacter allii]|uniref:type I-E CRISPR-associated protein Cas5/CasD n=1 Tax=Leucobacter allii TaxID=2932247 RepID=UPI001FD278B1|nr:type I-E CRISPR-associated protein Cas5/CasD [Leucobacter allii]UOR01728.1 type I-E CRISPR-associated protein Cas5/CasD [Leucobacter allii]
MSVLLLTLAGPLQAWGSRSRFTERHTELAPTKSGVIGMLAAARGLARTADLGALATLRFGVRIDQPGEIIRDFQTARSRDGKESMPLSQRYYLGDAVFLVGVESQGRAELERVQRELRAPAFPLFLGRRSCPPSGPIRTELRDGTIEEAFADAVWEASRRHRLQRRNSARVELETLIDASAGESGTFRVRDIPVSFAPEQRLHSWREVRAGVVAIPNPDVAPTPYPDEHDAFAAFTEGA